MSINTDPGFFPDLTVLQDLANSFFKSIESKEGIQPNVVTQQQNLPSGGQYRSGIPDPLAARPVSPVSLGGAGVSPGAINTVNAIDLHNRDPHLKDAGFSPTDKISPSVAGSGISPSAHHQNNEVDLSNPRTTLPDPHFQNDAAIDKNSTGVKLPGGISEHLNSISGFELFSFFENIPVLRSDFLPEPQIPGTAIIPDENAYYFIKESNEKGRVLKENSATPVDEIQAGSLKPPFDINLVRQDFPILQEKLNGKQLIWLDNAATTQKPRQVIDRISYFYEHENSNIHRAAHDLAARATDAYEGAREKVKNFLNAASSNEIVFVRGTTEAINLVAKTFGEQFLHQGDEIILSHLEHHANIVPWQQLAWKKNLKIRIIPVDDSGQIILDEYKKLLNSKTKLVSFTQVSNALGTITPAKQIIDLAHSNGSKVLLDGAQSVSHLKVDLQYLNPDFFVFSGHKIFGPTGIGVLYGKEELLNSLQPWQGGGNMIKDVTFERTEFHKAPFRFEAGTGNIADAVGLGAALDYVSKLGIQNINQYEHYLLSYATNLMKAVPGLQLIGTASEKASVLSFTLKGYTNEEVGKALSREAIAVRTGHHCAQPIQRRFGFESSVRPSLAFYNTCSEIDTLVAVLKSLKNK